MEQVETVNTILKELREFRIENNKKWDENDKRWDENERRWDENDKRWEENERRWNENDKRWEENERRWDENDKRWEENERRWDENDKRWEENEKRWNENQIKLGEINQRLDSVNQRVSTLETNRKADQKEVIRIFETTEKSVLEIIKEMERKLDIKFDTVKAILKQNEMEHDDFRKFLDVHGNIINLQNLRIKKLESWKNAFNSDDFVTV